MSIEQKDFDIFQRVDRIEKILGDDPSGYGWWLILKADLAALRDEVKRLGPRSYGANKNIQNHEREIGALRERVEALAKDAEHFRRFNAVDAEDLSALERRIRKLESPAPAAQREERCASTNYPYPCPYSREDHGKGKPGGHAFVPPAPPRPAIITTPPATMEDTLRVLGESAPRKEEHECCDVMCELNDHQPRPEAQVFPCKHGVSDDYCEECGREANDAMPRPEAQGEKCYYCGDETAGVCDDHAEMTKTAADWNRTDDHPAPSQGEKLCACGNVNNHLGPHFTPPSPGEKCEHGYRKEYTCPKCPADWQRPAPSPGEKDRYKTHAATCAFFNGTGDCTCREKARDDGQHRCGPECEDGCTLGGIAEPPKEKAMERRTFEKVYSVSRFGPRGGLITDIFDGTLVQQFPGETLAPVPKRKGVTFLERGAAAYQSFVAKPITVVEQFDGETLAPVNYDIAWTKGYEAGLAQQEGEPKHCMIPECGACYFYGAQTREDAKKLGIENPAPQQEGERSKAEARKIAQELVESWERKGNNVLAYPAEQSLIDRIASALLPEGSAGKGGM